MNKWLLAAIAAIGLIAAAGYYWFSGAPMDGMDHSGMAQTPASDNNAPASTKGYQQAMDGMMKAMMTPPTGKPDLDFAQGMIPHHQGAIDMAKVVIAHGKDAEIRKLAEGIIKAQEGEIAVFSKWLAETDKAALPEVPASTKANEQAMATMMKAMMAPYSGNADVDFVKGMIPHHQGAIDAAKAELQFGRDPTMLKLAQDIVVAQESEIAFMTAWLKTNSP